jgi:2-keto-3-deoxy-6-phosphogluconate aldolase
MVKKTMIQAGDFDQIKSLAKEAATIVKEIRG